MAVVKFARRYPANMVSHADVLKTMTRILRRAEIPVEFSQGFNPHMLLFFSPPLPLGVNSASEYVFISTQYMPGLLQRFNAACPSGMEALDVFNVVKNPNIANIAAWADYSIKAESIGKLDYDKLLKSESFAIRYNDKGSETQKDFRTFVHSVEVINDDEISARLKFGNINLRADRFVAGLEQLFNVALNAEICKTAIYDEQHNPIDSILRKEQT